ncbi:MAG TPA: tetratricopeptide repeat protein [Gemmatimonadales bacterium]|nr:tetratricopeptide repeat protein [Gemmatimonadales bacterium]
MLTAVLAVMLQAQTPELVSPLGRAFHARPDTVGVVARAESAAARAGRDVDTLIALGQAYASVWRYRDAIAAFTRALELAPDRAVLYRHRGHRFISTRQFERALADLRHGAALDSTSWDIWYHLGLVYYLTGRFDDAAGAFRRCLALRPADAGSVVAASDWLWMSLGRAGRRDEAQGVLAPIADTMAVGDNTAYHLRLLFYKGRRLEDDVRAAMAGGPLEAATLGYGLANWHLIRGDTARARPLLQEVVAGDYWPAFGFIAAEADLRRLR